MSENKRFNMIITGADGSFYYHDNVTDERIISTLELENKLNELSDENKQLKQFIKELTTKGTGRIDLASGYSYNVSTVLTGYRGDVE